VCGLFYFLKEFTVK